MFKPGAILVPLGKNKLFPNLEIYKTVKSTTTAFVRHKAKGTKFIDLVMFEGEHVYEEAKHYRKPEKGEIEQKKFCMDNIKYIQDLDSHLEIEPEMYHISSVSNGPKIAYKDEISAFQSALQMSITKEIIGWVVYKCPVCDNIHIGKQIDENETKT